MRGGIGSSGIMGSGGWTIDCDSPTRGAGDWGYGGALPGGAAGAGAMGVGESADYGYGSGGGGAGCAARSVCAVPRGECAADLPAGAGDGGAGGADVPAGDEAE